MITVTDPALLFISKALEMDDSGTKFIRVVVTKGGCAGFNYDVVIDNKFCDDDEQIEVGEYRVVFDPFTATMIDGSQLDFNENLIGRGFVLRNPRAEVTCGCGTSFNLKPRRSPMKHMRSKKEDSPKPV